MQTWTCWWSLSGAIWAWGKACSELVSSVVGESRLALHHWKLFVCPAISQSKMTCNTNISCVMPGPVGQYSFKYSLKSTQKDDTEEYEHIRQVTEKILSKLQKDASDCSAAVSRILAASFAHQKTNVLGAALASHLTRNKARFLFSHDTVWCPLRDIKKLLTGESVGAIVDHHGRTPFFICSALNYLCRPLELEDIGVKSFYANCEVVHRTSNNKDDLLEFCNGHA